MSDYHIRKFYKCPYCDKERGRNIQPDGRNKGIYKTCGSLGCILKGRSKPNPLKAHHGCNHPKWLTDRSKVKYRPRYEMTIWTREVFERDNYTCRACGQKGGNLQAHHILSYAKFPKQRWNLANGMTLCLSCHKKTDSYARNSV
jgi:5-methylcytosine-specific restriction endonuclease McrA